MADGSASSSIRRRAPTAVMDRRTTSLIWSLVRRPSTGRLARRRCVRCYCSTQPTARPHRGRWRRLKRKIKATSPERQQGAAPSLALRAGHVISRPRLLRRRDDVGAPSFAIEHHHAVHQREQRVVLAAADVAARMVARAALPDDDPARKNRLTAIHLDAQPLAVGLTSVAARTLTLLVRHCVTSKQHLARKAKLHSITFTARRASLPSAWPGVRAVSGLRPGRPTGPAV